MSETSTCPSGGQRLAALGNDARQSDPAGAAEWYRRAAIVQPDEPAYWNSLADVLLETGDEEGAYRMRRQGLEALERTTPLAASTIDEYVGELHRLAQAARQAGAEADYHQLVQKAHELAPEHRQTALAMAELLITSDKADRALALIDHLVEHHEAELTEEDRTFATYHRGLSLRALDRQSEAMQDLSETLAKEPLHEGRAGHHGRTTRCPRDDTLALSGISFAR